MLQFSLVTLSISIIFPIATIVQFSLAQDENIVYPCKTPDNFDAHCISLFRCPHLITSLTTLNPSAMDFVQKSICLGCEAGDFMVCCGQPRVFPSLDKNANNLTVVEQSNTIKDDIVNKTQRRQFVKDNLLPSTRFCGQQHSDYRVVAPGSVLVDLDEHPWLVQVKLSENVEDKYQSCGGIIINTQYILTDSLCGFAALSVTAGLYDTSSSITCNDKSTFRECTEASIEYQISKSVLMNGKVAKYGLALLKIDGAIQYSDYIRAICLPVDGSFRTENNLIYTGWGRSGSGVKKIKLNYDVKSSEVCYGVASGLKELAERENISVACLKPQGEHSNNTCVDVDQHGSPLVYQHNYRWYLDAIVSEFHMDPTMEFEECSNKQLASGFFIDSTMMDWILDNIED